MDVITARLFVDRKYQTGKNTTKDDKERSYGQILRLARNDRLKNHMLPRTAARTQPCFLHVGSYYF